ncbi:MAG: DUF4139 domain-containing protein [Bacteroidales bacterium]|nr:DUF4139 domain-containing protein [Bacteroidales bacterium]
MRKIVLIGLISIALCQLSKAQDPKETSSTIKHVTVFTQGAQIEREAAISFSSGQTIFKLTGLSPYIRKESIRIDGDGSFAILNVQHQNDYVNELEKSEEIAGLKEKIESLEDLIEEEKVRMDILGDKLQFLEANKTVTGKEQAMNPETFKSMNTYYGSSLESLKLELLKRSRQVEVYEKEKAKLSAQVNSISRRNDLPSGTILITLDSKQAKSSKLKFTYVVDNSNWYPSYDIRFMGVNEPLKITYKANIQQNTGIDWKDVGLTLSTSKTNVSAQIPELQTFYLQFYYPQISSSLSGQAAGVMVKRDAPGAAPQMQIRGISSVNEAEPLYVLDGMPVDDISGINPDDIASMEVLKDASSSAIYGSDAGNGVVLITTKKGGTEKSSVPMTITSRRETSAEFTVDAKQTIVSNSKTTSVSYKEAKLDAGFVYQSVPKLSEHVYLIAELTDWYKANLLDGEMNIYLEDSYVGKSTLNTQQFQDTLELSFGIDNNISIKREKLTDFSSSQFIGVNRKETIANKITIRNNKSYAVTTTIFDQVPVSTTKEIEVETIELAGAKMNKDNGELEWEISLQPNETKELIVKYEVRYPKNKKVIIE